MDCGHQQRQIFYILLFNNILRQIPNMIAFHINNIKNIEEQNSKYHVHLKTKSAIIVVEENGDASVGHYGKKHGDREDKSL